ncbi:unnamed protein product [Haemonchus placei]|uniref:FAS1 domain-containing protein n=1 Tax=Haemonchus placei TaxID=6290 RepID=A0A0N4X210_HAEPC|nr:unnamed protein product [Haemonchus placei]
MAVLRLLLLLAAVCTLGIAQQLTASDGSAVAIAFQDDADFDDIDKIAEKM